MNSETSKFKAKDCLILIKHSKTSITDKLTDNFKSLIPKEFPELKVIYNEFLNYFTLFL